MPKGCEPDEGAAAQIKGVEAELAEVDSQQSAFEAKEAELKAFEEAHPEWNVDNMSTDKHNRTIINKPKPKPAQDEKQKAEDMTQFFKVYGDEAKQFGMLSKPEDSHAFLKERPHLVCEHLGSYLVIWAVDLQVEEKTELMQRVARQAITMQYIFELAKSMDTDPKACVDPFFRRIKTAEKQYVAAFEDEYNALIKRVEGRAVARMEEARAEAEAEAAAEREARLGPAGLDPLEVLEELPAGLREAFEAQDTPRLQAEFAALSPEEVQRTYQRVVGSGLWVPAGGGDAAEDEGEAAAAE